MCNGVRPPRYISRSDEATLHAAVRIARTVYFSKSFFLLNGSNQWCRQQMKEGKPVLEPGGLIAWITRDLALASMARDDPHASSTAAAMRGKVGSEFET